MLNAPSRRNSSVSAPYLQDGAVTTLPEVVRLTARYQSGRQIVEFLNTLTTEASHVGRGFGPAVELPLDAEFPEYSSTPVAILDRR